MRNVLQYCLFRLSLVVALLYGYCASAQKLPFTNYHTADGMINNRCHFITQDGKGYIWIGTDFGIDRYDGRTFKHFSCPDYPYRGSRYGINDGAGVLVSIDRYGIALCFGDSVRFIKLKAEDPGYSAGALRMNDSTFYVATQHSFFVISGNRQHEVLLPDSIGRGHGRCTNMARDRKGNVWIGLSKGLLYMPSGDLGKATKIPFFDTVSVNSFVEDKNGDMYIMGHNGVYKYTQAQINDLQHEKPGIVFRPVPEITNITFDSSNNIWMSSTYNGLYKYNRLTKSVSNYDIEHGLVSQNTWDVLCDNEQNIWVASENGIGKLTSSDYSSVDFSASGYQNIKSSTIWNDSVFLFSNMVDMYALVGNSVEKIRNYSNNVGYLKDVIQKMPGNKLLVNFSKRVNSAEYIEYSVLYDFRDNALVDGRPLANMPGHIRLADISAGIINDDKELWINTSEGLQLYTGGSFHKVPPLIVDGKPAKISYITGDANRNIWIIDGNKRVVRFSKIRNDSSSFPYSLLLEEIIPEEQFSHKFIYKLFVDSRGYVWVGTSDRGLYLFKENKNGSFVGRQFSGNVLSCAIINCITEDKYHNIWVGTALGLDKMTPHLDTFSIEKALYGNELCGKYIYFVQINNNKLYVGSTGCVGIIDLEKNEPAFNPAIYISGIEVNDKNVLGLLEKKPSFEPGENTMTFSLTGISYKDGQRIRYSFMLEGLDENWSPPTANYFITYWHIPPGTYTFKAKALSSNGLWSKQPAQFTFTVRQPFYTRWWFLTFCLILISSVVYSVYRYRINKILEIQRIRQTISKDLHDDIGATVSSINILANMAKSDLVSDSRRNQFLETIQEESKHVSESLNDIVWSVNPKNDSLDIIIARMQRYASEVLEARNIAYRFILPHVPVDELRMDMTKRQNVYLIFKEAVNNLVKYSNATVADITLAVDNDVFTMIVADNGIGFEPGTVREGNGMINMRKRAEDIHAQLAIKSTPGTGVMIKLVVVL